MSRYREIGPKKRSSTPSPKPGSKDKSPANADADGGGRQSRKIPSSGKKRAVALALYSQAGPSRRLGVGGGFSGKGLAGKDDKKDKNYKKHRGGSAATNSTRKSSKRDATNNNSDKKAAALKSSRAKSAAVSSTGSSTGTGTSQAMPVGYVAPKIKVDPSHMPLTVKSSASSSSEEPKHDVLLHIPSNYKNASNNEDKNGPRRYHRRASSTSPSPMNENYRRTAGSRSGSGSKRIGRVQQKKKPRCSRLAVACLIAIGVTCVAAIIVLGAIFGTRK